MSRWVFFLLAAILIAQGWILRVHQQMRSELRAVQQRQEYEASKSQLSLADLRAVLEEREAVPDWLTRPQTSLTLDPGCIQHTARISWSLKEWTPGTRARLQYRRGLGDPWTEARVTDLGLQSYAAEFPIPGGPGLHWRLYLNSPNRTGPSMVYLPPDAQQFRTGYPSVPALQYRIVADVPGGSRAAAPQPLVLGPQLTIDANLTVTVGANGDYEVTAVTQPRPEAPCARIGRIVAWAVPDTGAVSEHLLEPVPGAPNQLLARWTSDRPLLRIDLEADYGHVSTKIPVELGAAR